MRLWKAGNAVYYIVGGVVTPCAVVDQVISRVGACYQCECRYWLRLVHDQICVAISDILYDGFLFGISFFPLMQIAISRMMCRPLSISLMIVSMSAAVALRMVLISVRR